MQRLVLAVLIAALVIGVLAIAAQGLRAALTQGPDRREQPGQKELPMQKFAVFLLLALMLYVAGSGVS